jgi:hypothetical protein
MTLALNEGPDLVIDDLPPLHRAAKEGKLDPVRQVLQRAAAAAPATGADSKAELLVQRDDKGLLALHHAICFGHTSVVEELLKDHTAEQLQATVIVQGHKFVRELETSWSAPRAAVLQSQKLQLLQADACIDWTEGITALHLALGGGKAGLTQDVRGGGSLHVQKLVRYDVVACILSAAKRSETLVELLLQEDSQMFTPLMCLCHHNILDEGGEVENGRKSTMEQYGGLYMSDWQKLLELLMQEIPYEQLKATTASATHPKRKHIVHGTTGGTTTPSPGNALHVLCSRIIEKPAFLSEILRLFRGYSIKREGESLLEKMVLEEDGQDYTPLHRMLLTEIDDTIFYGGYEPTHGHVRALLCFSEESDRTDSNSTACGRVRRQQLEKAMPCQEGETDSMYPLIWAVTNARGWLVRAMTEGGSRRDWMIHEVEKIDRTKWELALGQVNGNPDDFSSDELEMILHYSGSTSSMSLVWDNVLQALPRLTDEAENGRLKSCLLGISAERVTRRADIEPLAKLLSASMPEEDMSAAQIMFCVFITSCENPLGIALMLQTGFNALSELDRYRNPESYERLHEVSELMAQIACGLVNTWYEHDCALEALLSGKYDGEENLRLASRTKCKVFLAAPAVQKHLNEKVWGLGYEGSEQAWKLFFRDIVQFIQFLLISLRAKPLSFGQGEVRGVVRGHMLLLLLVVYPAVGIMFTFACTELMQVHLRWLKRCAVDSDGSMRKLIEELKQLKSISAASSVLRRRLPFCRSRKVKSALAVAHADARGEWFELLGSLFLITAILFATACVLATVFTIYTRSESDEEWMPTYNEVDLVLAVWVFGLLTIELEDLWMSYKEQRSLRASLLAYLNFWNGVDLVGLVLATITMGLRVWIAINPSGTLYLIGCNNLCSDDFATVALILLWVRLLVLLTYHPNMGPLLMMVVNMITKDLTQFVCISTFIFLCFSAGFQYYFAGGGDERTIPEEVAQRHKSLSRSLIAIWQHMVEGGALDNFVREDQMPTFLWWLMLVESVVVVLLLANLLIAMFAKTFDEISENRDLEYVVQGSQRILQWDNAAATRPPFNLLHIGYKILRYVFRKIFKCLGKIKKTQSEIELSKEVPKLIFLGMPQLGPADGPTSLQLPVRMRTFRMLMSSNTIHKEWVQIWVYVNSIIDDFRSRAHQTKEGLKMLRLFDQYFSDQYRERGVHFFFVPDEGSGKLELHFTMPGAATSSRLQLRSEHAICGELFLDDAAAKLLHGTKVFSLPDGLHLVRGRCCMVNNREEGTQLQSNPELHVSVKQGQITAVRSFSGSHFDLGRVALRRKLFGALYRNKLLEEESELREWDEGDLDEAQLCEQLCARKGEFGLDTKALQVAEAYCMARDARTDMLQAALAKARHVYQSDVGKDLPQEQCYQRLSLKSASAMGKRNCDVCNQQLDRETSLQGISWFWTCEEDKCDFDVCARCHLRAFFKQDRNAPCRRTRYALALKAHTFVQAGSGSDDGWKEKLIEQQTAIFQTMKALEAQMHALQAERLGSGDHSLLQEPRPAPTSLVRNNVDPQAVIPPPV